MIHTKPEIHNFVLEKTTFCKDLPGEVKIKFLATAVMQSKNEYRTSIREILSTSCPDYKSCARNKSINCSAYLGLKNWTEDTISQELPRRLLQKKQQNAAQGKCN